VKEAKKGGNKQRMTKENEIHKRRGEIYKNRPVKEVREKEANK
jgi:hypothetical protein